MCAARRAASSHRESNGRPSNETARRLNRGQRLITSKLSCRPGHILVRDPNSLSAVPNEQTSCSNMEPNPEQLKAAGHNLQNKTVTDAKKTQEQHFSPQKCEMWQTRPETKRKISLCLTFTHLDDDKFVVFVRLRVVVWDFIRVHIFSQLFFKKHRHGSNGLRTRHQRDIVL